MAVHCKAGKGRTGTFICIYLIWSGICQSSTEAIRMFGQARTHDGKGVTIPSQLRYIKYFETALRTFQQALPPSSAGNFRALVRQDVGAILPPPRPLMLFKIVFSSVPRMDLQGGCEPWMSITNNGVTVYHSQPLRMAPGKVSTEVAIDDIAVQDDVRIEFFHRTTAHKMFSFVLNTAYIKENVVLWKQDLDRACRDKENRVFQANFHIFVCFREFSEQDRQRTCVACGGVLAPHDRTISDGDRAWHVACARCRECGQPVGARVTFDRGEPVCAACCARPGTALAAAAFFRYCAECRDVIDDDRFVEAAGHMWHTYCFRCAGCRRTVDPQAPFHAEPARTKGRSLADMRHRVAIGSRQQQQQADNVISERTAAAAAAAANSQASARSPLVLIYCPDCDTERRRVAALQAAPSRASGWKTAAAPGAVPRTRCNAPQTARSRKSIMFSAQKPVVPASAPPPVVAPPVAAHDPTPAAPAPAPAPATPPPEAPHCAKCARPIAKEVVQALGKLFHPACFVCGRCGAGLAGQQFFAGPNSIPLCRACGDAILAANMPVCAKCRAPITDASYVAAADGKYHQACFVCAHCGRQLESQYMARDGRLYCVDDFNALFGHRCATCGAPIAGKYLELDGRQYHPACFRCPACGKELSTTPFLRLQTGECLCQDCAVARTNALQQQQQQQQQQSQQSQPQQPQGLPPVQFVPQPVVPSSPMPPSSTAPGVQPPPTLPSFT